MKKMNYKQIMQKVTNIEVVTYLVVTILCVAGVVAYSFGRTGNSNPSAAAVKKSNWILADIITRLTSFLSMAVAIEKVVVEHFPKREWEVAPPNFDTPIDPSKPVWECTEEEEEEEKPKDEEPTEK
jgi:hypothetical protein